MKKIKILHVLHSVGGVDVALRTTVANLDDTKFQNIVVHGNDDTKTPIKDKSGSAVKEYKIGISREINLVKDIKAIVNTYKIIKREKPHIVQTHSAKGGVVGRSAALLLGVPALHTPQAFSYLSTDSAIKRRIYLAIERFFSKHKKSALLAISESERRRGIDEVGFNPSSVFLFNNAIRPIRDLSELKIPQTWPSEYVCTVSRPSYQKNVELMLRVIDRVRMKRPIHLVIMGVGFHSDSLSKVKDLITELRLEENITMLDWTDREDVLQIISRSKLYLSTARYEGMPYSVIESLALSIPCVVSDCDGNRDLIRDDYNGYVIKKESVEDFANRIDQVLGDADLWKRLSENAFKTFEREHNIEKSHTELESIYASYAGR